jgi:predicted O-methyltransferase YrrM
MTHDPWSLADDALTLLADEVAGGRSTVIECGSGVSTVAIARALRDAGRGSVFSLEDEAEHAGRTRAALAREQLEPWARVIDAPLSDEPLAQRGCRWYSRAALDQLPRGADLLLVDGPVASPGSGAERSRYPALPLLRRRLAPGCLVVLDDAQREGERWVIERWRAEFALDLQPTARRLAAGLVPG